MSAPSRVVASLALLLGLAACSARAGDATEPAPASAQAAADAQADTAAAAAREAEIARLEALYRARADSALAQYTEADVHFMTGMIAHHAQALVMTDLARERTDSEDLLAAAGRITTSQDDEIAFMARWLQERDAEVPDPPVTWEEWREREHPGAHAGHGMMPGMATDEELRRLARTRGGDFDRLFLELMIDHHRGALVMVEELFGTEGGGNDPEVYLFASDVDADQRAEIARMQRMLESRLQRGGR